MRIWRSTHETGMWECVCVCVWSQTEHQTIRRTRTDRTNGHDARLSIRMNEKTNKYFIKKHNIVSRNTYSSSSYTHATLRVETWIDKAIRLNCPMVYGFGYGYAVLLLLIIIIVYYIYLKCITHVGGVWACVREFCVSKLKQNRQSFVVAFCLTIELYEVWLDSCVYGCVCYLNCV